jgi:hypothetical protein
LEAKKLSIRERELKLEELKSAKEQLQMLQCTSEDDVDPEVWTMMKEHKKRLQQFIFSFSSMYCCVTCRTSGVESCFRTIF